MKKNFILSFVFLSFSCKDVWAFFTLKQAELILTQAMAYQESFVFLEKGQNLFLAKYSKDNLSLYKITEFGQKPDIIRHFPVENGHLIATLYNAQKKLSLIAFKENGEIYFRKNIRLESPIKNFDLRMTSGGELICLFYSLAEKDQIHLLQIYDGKKYLDLVLSETTFDAIFLQLAVNGAHALTRLDGQMVWISSVRQILNIHYLPHYITNAVFFLWKGQVYLVGIDTRNNLYRYYITNDGLQTEKIFSSVDLHFVRKIIPFTFNGKLNFFLFAPALQKAICLEIGEFETLKEIKPYSRPLVAEWEDIQPVVFEKDLYFLQQSSLLHVYGESFFSLPLFYEVNFRLALNKNPVELIIFWKTRGNNAYSYWYLFDKKPDSEPIEEEKILNQRQITFRNFEEGDYVLHIQAKDLKEKKKSNLYHIPIKWRYRPNEPQVILLNEVAPSLVPSGTLEFFVVNPFPGEYFAEINTKPKTEPVKPIAFNKEGRMSLPLDVRPGSYYLHLRVKDPRSGEFSPSLHQLFFVDSYNPHRDPALSKAKSELQDLEILFEEIRKSRKNLPLLKKKVRELEKKGFPQDSSP